MSIEEIVHDFVKAGVEAAASGSPLHGAEVLRDEYAEITKVYGVRVGKCVSRVAPGPGDDLTIKHFDALVTLIFYVRVERGQKHARSPYRERALALAEATALLFFGDPEMGGRADNSRPLRIPRGMDDTDASSYAVANLIVVVNETGQIDFEGVR